MYSKISPMKIVKFQPHHNLIFQTADSVGCSTVHDTKDSNKTCIFPFNWNGTSHHSCNLDEDKGYWCSTEVTDETSGFIDDKWGICSSKCQGKNMISMNYVKHGKIQGCKL